VVKTPQLWCALFLGAWTLTAQGGELRVWTDRAVVETGKPFLIHVETEGEEVGSVTLPTVTGLHVDAQPAESTERRMTFRGRLILTRTQSHYARATTLGRVTVAPFKATIDGEEVESAPLTVTAVQALGVPRDPRGDVEGVAPDRNTGALLIAREARWPQDYVRSEAYVTKAEVFQGEPLQLVLELYVLNKPDVETDIRRGMPIVMPTMNGFFVDEARSYHTFRVLDGLDYRVQEIRAQLYPLTIGRLTIGSWRWEGGVRDSNARPPQRHRFNLTTESIEVQVKALPPAPETFSGAVGTFKLSGHLTPEAPGKGVTTRLTLMVQGSGNPDGILPFVVSDVPGLRVTEPDVATKRFASRDGVQFEKSWGYTVAASSPGAYTMPALTFTYFDPETGGYRTARAGPFEVNSASSTGEPVIPTRAAELDGPIVGSAYGLAPIRTRAPLSSSRKRAGWLFAVTFTAPIAAYAMVFGVVRRRRRFEANSARTRAYAARLWAHSRLNEVEALPELLEAISRALTDFLAAWCQADLVGMTSVEAEQLLLKKHVEPDLLLAVVRVLKRCERARYGTRKLTDAELNALMQGTSHSIDQLDRFFRKTVRI
jgi:oxygen tolerance protein BatD